MTELKDLRKKKTITLPSGAKVDYWDDDTYGDFAEMEKITFKNATLGSDGKPQFTNINGDELRKALDDQFLNRIISWDYTEDGQALEINIENLYKLPRKDVAKLREIITPAVPTKNG